MIKIKVICDSVAPCGKRLTTIEATYPRFIHSELLTHRMLSRNSASSRAIPWERYDKENNLVKNCMKWMILNNPVIPIKWGLQQTGMQTSKYFDPGSFSEKCAKELWLEARDRAVEQAEKLMELGIHKSLVNRLTEPWMWITVIISATEWQNFFRLRCHPDAEIHMQTLAYAIRDAMNTSVPKPLRADQWHLPYIEPGVDVPGPIKNNEEMLWYLKRISAARCARVSYLTHDGKRDISKDIDLFKKLIERDDNIIHSSPLEHVAMALEKPKRIGNFVGWKQFRKEFANENVE